MILVVAILFSTLPISISARNHVSDELLLSFQNVDDETQSPYILSSSQPSPTETIFDSSLTYKIINKESTKELVAAKYGTDPSDGEVYQNFFIDTVDEADGFAWLLMPAEDPYYWIVNKVSGKGLVAGSYGIDLDDNNVYLNHMNTNIMRDASKSVAFKWELEKVDGGYKIINKVNRYVLVAGSYGTNPSDGDVWQESPTNITESNADGFIWNIEEYKKLDCSEQLKLDPGTSPEDIGDIPHLTSMNDVPPPKTEYVIIGQALIPFFAVNDQNQPSEIRVMDNPYYIVTREGYWQRVYYQTHQGLTEDVKRESTTVGLKESITNSMENTIGCSLSASASVSFGLGGFGAEASLSATFERELKVGSSQSIEEEKTETKEITRTYFPGNKIAEAIWFRADKYTIKRLNNDTISQSTWIDETTQIADAFEEPTGTTELPITEITIIGGLVLAVAVAIVAYSVVKKRK